MGYMSKTQGARAMAGYTLKLVNYCRNTGSVDMHKEVLIDFEPMLNLNTYLHTYVVFILSF